MIMEQERPTMTAEEISNRIWRAGYLSGYATTDAEMEQLRTERMKEALAELGRTIDHLQTRSSEHRNRLVYLKALEDVKAALGLEEVV